MTTKTQQAAIDQIDALGGIVKSSAWTTGSGRHVKGRAIPPGFAKFYRERYDLHTPEVAAYFAANKRVSVVIARSPLQEWVNAVICDALDASNKGA